jgi:hypothetical protein
MSNSDEPYPLPQNLKLVPRAEPEPMSDRGARLPDPPKSDARTIGPEADELRTLVAKIITVWGAAGKPPVPDWVAGEALKIADPHRQAPFLIRWAAMLTLRALADEERRAFKPRPEAVKWIAEAEEAEAVDVRRKAAEEAEAHRLRCVPLNCGLCGKNAADERGSLIIQYAPPVRICGTCIATELLTALQRRRAAEASARAAKALEAACVRDSRRPKGRP